MVQLAFTQQILAAAKQMGLHTAIETSGFLGARADEKFLSYLDLVLLDIKTTVESRVQRLLDFEHHRNRSRRALACFDMPGNTLHCQTREMRRLRLIYHDLHEPSLREPDLIGMRLGARDHALDRLARNERRRLWRVTRTPLRQRPKITKQSMKVLLINISPSARRGGSTLSDFMESMDGGTARTPRTEGYHA